MTTLERRYRRLLGWYPASWRRLHGEVMLGTLLDAAEADDRTRPTAAEVWSLRVNGAGERLTPGTGAVFSVLAFLGSGIGLILTMGFTTSAWAEPARIGLGAFLAPTAISAAVLCLLRYRRSVTPARAMALVGLATIAWALSALAAAAWSIGFDEADAGLPASPLAAAFMPLFLGGWSVGGIAVAVLVRTLLGRMPGPLGWSIGILIGVFVPPALGTSTISPMTALAASGALTIVFAVHAGGRIPRADPTGRPVGLRSRRRIAAIAGVALAASILALLIAVTGAHWLPGADGTRAVQVGLAVGEFAAVPLVAVCAWAAARRSGSAQALVWGGAVVLAAGILLDAGTALASDAAASGAIPWVRLLPASLGVGAIAAGALRVTARSRVLVGMVAAVGGFYPLWGLLVGAAVLSAMTAVVLLVWGLRRPPGIRLDAPISA